MRPERRKTTHMSKVSDEGRDGVFEPDEAVEAGDDEVGEEEGAHCVGRDVARAQGEAGADAARAHGVLGLDGAALGARDVLHRVRDGALLDALHEQRLHDAAVVRVPAPRTHPLVSRKIWVSK